eukprot:2817737-Rhodomonas_salina.1
MSGVVLHGSRDGLSGKPATLISRDKIEIVDAAPLYFVLPSANWVAAESTDLEGMCSCQRTKSPVIVIAPHVSYPTGQQSRPPPQTPAAPLAVQWPLTRSWREKEGPPLFPSS